MIVGEGVDGAVDGVADEVVGEVVVTKLSVKLLWSLSLSVTPPPPWSKEKMLAVKSVVPSSYG